MKQREPPSDIIEALVMENVFSNDGEKDQLTKDDILEEFTIILAAGVETTSNFTIFMLSEILKNPEIEKKIREEIELYMQEDDYSFENLKQFKYLECVQK